MRTIVIEGMDNNNRCWSLVESMGPALCTARLSMVLNRLQPAELDAFCRWLSEVDSQLDTEAHREYARHAYELARSGRRVQSWTAPVEECPADPAELRATVIACGRDAWRVVALAPELLTGGWPTGLGRAFLLTVASARRRSLTSAGVR